MPPDDWRIIPTDALAQADQQQTADDWAAKQRAQVAQDWGQAWQQQAPQVSGRASEFYSQGVPDAPLPVAPSPGGDDSAPLDQPAAAPSSVSPSPTSLQSPAPSAAPAAAAPPPAASGTDWLSVAQSQLGKPYIWGSAGGRSDFSDQAAGFDCSGFVSYVMQKGFGVNLPAFTGSAYQATTPISAQDARPGDVVLYNMNNPDPHIQHIAIYLGNGQVIQAGGTRNDVNIASVGNAGSYEFRRPAGLGNPTHNALAQDVVASQLPTPPAGDDYKDAQAVQGPPSPAPQLGGIRLGDVPAQPGADSALQPAAAQGPLYSPQLSTLDPSSPIGRQAAGQPTIPYQVKDQIVQGAADALVPQGTPVLNGAARLALDPSMILPGEVGNYVGGKVLGKVAGPVAEKAGQLASKLAPDMPDAALYGPTELNAGLSPESLKRAAAPLGHALNTVFQPIANATAPVKQAFVDLANTIGRESHGSRVVAENLANDVQRVLGDLDSSGAADAMRTFEQTGELVANPTPEQQAVAKQLRDYFAQTGEQGRAQGWITGDVTQAADGPQNYFPHVWAEDPNAPGQVVGAARKGMNANDFYSQGRKYLTVDEALQAGKEPVSVSDAVAKYGQHAEDSMAKATFIEQLQANAPDALQAVDKDHPAPQGWVSGLQIDPRMSSPLRGYAFDPSVGKSLQNLLGVSAMRENPVGQAWLKAQSTGKQTIFSLSNFHLYTELLTRSLADPTTGAKMAQAFASPGYYTGQRFGPMQDTFARAAKAGVTGLFDKAAPDAPDVIQNPLIQKAVQGVVGGAGAAGLSVVNDVAAHKSPQETTADALKWGAVGAGASTTIAPVLTKALWERAVPMAKVTLWDSAVRAGVPPQDAADYVNRTIGGLNYSAMGRNQTFQDVMRTIIQAPDWNEATIRTFGKALFGPNQQNLSRELVIKAVLGIGATEQVLNMATTRHTTFQNEQGHQLEVQLPSAPGKKPVYVGLMPGNIQSYLNDAVAGNAKGYLRGRASWPVSTVGEQVFDRANSSGPKGMSAAQTAGYHGAQAVSRLAPIGVSQVEDAQKNGVPLWEALMSGVLGTNLRYGKQEKITGNGLRVGGLGGGGGVGKVGSSNRR